MSIVQGIMVMYLGTLSVIDLRKKKIHVCCLIFGIFIMAASMIESSNPLWYERLAGAGIGLGMLLVSVITKEAIGKADCILMLYLGVMLGYAECLKLLFFSFLICSIVCMVCLGFRVVTRKQRMAFVPFLFVGFLCNLLWQT